MNDSLDKLGQLSRSLFRDILGATATRDQRCASAGAPWWKRHRLRVLLEALRIVGDGAQVGVLELYFAAELAATVPLVREYATLPLWPHVVRALTNEYTHTVGQLLFASHLRTQGLSPELVPNATRGTPDLRFVLPHGQYPLFVEVYQPRDLDGRPISLDSVRPEAIVRKALGKAKEQLGRRRIGILAIVGLNMAPQLIGALEAAARKYADRPDMPSFAGFAVLGTGLRIVPGSACATSNLVLNVRYALNDRYFGAIRFATPVPATARIERKDRRTLCEVSHDQTACVAVLHSSGPDVPPFFRGQGPVDFACPKCGVVLADGVWLHSVDRVVVECPKCFTLSRFTIPPALVVPRVELTGGSFYFSAPVDVRQGVVLGFGPVEQPEP